MRVHRKYFERVVIIGPNFERKAALNHLLDRGFSVMRSGPKPVGFRRLDMDKFKIVAEKEIKKRR